MKHNNMLLSLSMTLLVFHFAAGKTIESEFQLSPSNTEAVVGAFCISPRKRGHLKFTLSWDDEAYSLGGGNNRSQAEGNGPEEENIKNGLTLRLYRDDNWTNFEAAASCTEKAALSIEHQLIKTTPDTAQQLSGNNIRSNGTTPQIISMHIPNSMEHRAHYYYMVMSDCSLVDEFFMDRRELPLMEYTLELTNNGSHLSADELHLNIMHMVTMFVSGMLGTLLALKALIQFYEKNTIHAAVLWVMAAAASDSLASLLAIIHLELYAHNGIGSPLLDSLSSHLEATCDSLVALLLLSIGAGWTLPSDVVKVRRSRDVNNILHKIMISLQSPFGGGSLESSSPTAMLAAFICLSHILLAQWGLHYHNTDFDSYHDLEHLPGKVLMGLRVILGICLWVCCANTKLHCPPSLVGFYNKLALVGTLWFESLPILVWIVDNAVAFHLRHRTIGVWGASLQIVSIALLSWLVTAHSTPYHKLSHLSTAPQDTFTERLASSAGEGRRTWTMFGKAKVRLD